MSVNKIAINQTTHDPYSYKNFWRKRYLHEYILFQHSLLLEWINFYSHMDK